MSRDSSEDRGNLTLLGLPRTVMEIRNPRPAGVPDGNEPVLLAAACTGDRGALERLLASHRPELKFHCYRMLGSLHEADDVAQETLIRAWRSIGRFGGRTSLRNWLYRIATNACLTALSRRARSRRILPERNGPPSNRMPRGQPPPDIAWLDPYPDAAIEQIADSAPGPDARFQKNETVRLAFVAAIQYLPPRQRAVLLLRDVLGWSANETSQTLAMTVASANSALQRARSTLRATLSPDQAEALPLPEGEQKTLLERYVQMWEGADLEGLVSLLREDASLSMPPWPQWYRGRVAVRKFFAWAFDWAWHPRAPGAFRFVPTSANGQPALAMYVRGHGAAEFHAHAIQMPAVRKNGIGALMFFVDRRLFVDFGLPPTLPAQAGLRLRTREAQKP